MKIGFSGAHRTGKTTLAMSLAVKHNFVFQPTGVSNISRKHAVTNGWETTMAIQTEIADSIAKQFIKAEPKTLFDRSMLDVLAYTEHAARCTFNGRRHPSQQDLELFGSVTDYITERLVLADFTFIIQTGIEFVADEKSFGRDSQEAINSDIIAYAETFLPANRYFIMPKEVTDLEERIAVCEYVLRVKKVIR